MQLVINTDDYSEADIVVTSEKTFLPVFGVVYTFTIVVYYNC